MASLGCFINYVKQAQQNSQLGLLSRDELTDLLLKKGMTQQEVDQSIEALNELYKARVKEVLNKRMDQNQRALLNAVYRGGILNLNERQMMEDIAGVMGVPVITEAEMKHMSALAHLADSREGSEKALIEEQIRNILAQKQPDFYGRLNGSKVAFKVLLSAGFNILSYISNQKKILEMYAIQRLRLLEQGKGVFTPYQLKEHKQATTEFASAMAKASRGTTEESGYWKRLKATLGLAETALLGPTATMGADISHYSDALEHSNPHEEQKGVWAIWRRIDRKLARTSKRWLSSIDASAKIKMGEIFYFNELYNTTKADNPTMTEPQILQSVYKNMFSVSRDDAEVKALKQFTDWKIFDKNGNVNIQSNRFKVRVAEIMREGRDPAVMSRAFETAASKVWQGRMTYPSMKNDPYDLTKFQQRLDSGLGGLIADALTSLRNVMENATGQSMVAKSFVFSLFGFVNGATAYWQDFIEHNIFYGGGKTLRLIAMRKNQNLSEEQRAYLEDKIIEMKGKVIFGVVEAAVLAGLSMLVNKMCKDAGGFTGSITPDKPMGAQAAETNTEMQRPESALNFCDKFSIPLEWLGGFSVSNLKLMSTFIDRMENKNEGFISSAMHAIVVTSAPTIAPVMDQNPGPVSRIWDAYQTASKRGEGYDNVYHMAERELSMAASNMALRSLPIPQRLMKEATYVAIPYRSYMPAGIGTDPHETLLNFFYQTGIQSVYAMGNTTGVTQLINLTTTQDGKIGKPIFDYRHRPVDMGNLYDGKSIAAASKFVRDIYLTGQGKTPILYDEKDHFLAMNEVNIPFDSRIYTVLYKDDPDQTRQLSDNEYYNYTFAYTKKFGEWYDSNYDKLTKLDPKDVRSTVTKRLGDIKRSALRRIENDNSISAEDLYKHL